MRYIAVPQLTCAWLLAQPTILGALAGVLLNVDLKALGSGEIAYGPLRAVGSSDGRLLAIWNREHLSGIGSEDWCIFRLEPPMGLLSMPEVGQQVLERILYVANQRLQGLMLDSELIHRARPNGSHTCLAGRGNEARQYSISYVESNSSGAAGGRCIMIIGPEHDFDDLEAAMSSEMSNIDKLVDLANSLTESNRRRPLIDAPSFESLRRALAPSQADHHALEHVSIETEYNPSNRGANAYETMHWDYDQWIKSGELNDVQRRVLGSDALLRHPVRIIGPAGSGKTLLMQLLALRYLRLSETENRKTRILYVVHNAPMAATVIDRLKALGAEDYLTSNEHSVTVTTLSEYGRKAIGLPENSVINLDAQKTKLYQLEQIRESLSAAMAAQPKVVAGSQLLSQVSSDDTLLSVFSILVMAEISTVIKGRGLVGDEKRYVNAESAFSRLHRILSTKERSVIFDCFKRYNFAVFEQMENLDSDDIALTLAGGLRTPLWELRRKTEGFDFIFVDEAQLFNENERRVFAYLSKGTSSHVPIVLALDEAQEPFGFTAAGFATLGIVDIESETLPSNHRSTKEIVDLSFFVIQRTTDLFGSDFPDFSDSSRANAVQTPSPHGVPAIARFKSGEGDFGHFILGIVQALRSKNVRQIAVICHAEAYWETMLSALQSVDLPLHIITQRGEKLSPDQPLIVLSRPSYIGGQEFDAVLLVGLEQGVNPPRVSDNPPLAAALEQQSLREMYLTISRARSRVIVALNRDASPNTTIADALQQNLIVDQFEV